MSFEQPAGDQPVNPNATADQPLTFNVGERSFNAESASTKIQAADEHIARLEAENASYKAKVDQSTSIDEALAQLRESKNAEPQNSQTTEHTSAVSEEQIGEIANRSIEAYLASERVKTNDLAAQELASNTYRETGEKLTAIYGDRTDEAMATKAAELGVTTKSLFDMAKNPATAQMLLESMKVNAAPSQSSPQGGFNTGSHISPTEKFVNYEKPITSSTLIDALKKAGATY